VIAAVPVNVQDNTAVQVAQANLNKIASDPTATTSAI
jgi:hypothetical protein